ncbi:MAG TPA: DUF5652 family protein [Candidatus Paceibacterota bacterium]|jgi:hypothetical protein|nr:DUF5652 family protein [Candidatus Paceibacterota bacterium]
MSSISASWGGPFAAFFTGSGAVVLVIIVIWSIFWKGLALWRSARNGSKIWFIVLLIVNTLGILEILYIYVFSKMGKKRAAMESQSQQGGSENK